MKYLILSMVLFLGMGLNAQVSKKAQKLFDAGSLAYLNGNTELALEKLGKVVEICPSHAEAYGIQGKILSDLERYDEALAVYEKAGFLNPDKEHRTLYEMGKILMTANRLEEAKARFEEVIVHENSRAELERIANLQLNTVNFRIEAIANPVPFVPISLGDSLNSDFPEYLPTLTVDEEAMYFTRRLKGQAYDNEQFFVSRKDSLGEWSNAIEMSSKINTAWNEGALSISPDGKRLFFAATDRSDSYGGYDIYYSFKVADKWSNPKNINRPVSTQYWDSQPSISADGKELYFSSKRPSSKGGADLYMSRLENNRWQDPVNLTLLNTKKDEQCPFIHPDGNTLYFSSNGHMGMGDADLFLSKRQEDGSWGTPINLGYPINNHDNQNSLIVSADGTRGFYSAFNEETDLDLFTFEMPTELQPEFVTYIKGVVRSAETQEAVYSKVEITNLETGASAGQTISSKADGSFLISLPTGADYSFTVSHPDYLFYSKNLQATRSNANEPLLLTIELSPIAKGETIVLENIFFETGSFVLEESSFTELDKLADLLQKNPTTQITIIGHTDNVGSEDANKSLSKKRAQAVQEYLINTGITSNRCLYEGMGEAEPIADNETAEGRSKNRRTEIKLR
ncbi:OmpA family protein [Chitinophagales bacterium]|nr:OmpA family protein [Chitinophagales bacterium]